MDGGKIEPSLQKTFKDSCPFRTNQSQFYFATGLFDRRVALSDVRYEPAVDPHDPIIRFYKVCKKWQKEVKKNPESLKEQRLFEQSEKVQLHNIN